MTNYLCYGGFFGHLIYSARKNRMAIKTIDAALCSGSVGELLDLLGLTDNLSHLFSDEGAQHAVVSDDHSSYNDTQF